MNSINLLVLAFIGLFWVPLLPFYFAKGLRGTLNDWENLTDTAIASTQEGLPLSLQTPMGIEGRLCFGAYPTD